MKRQELKRLVIRALGEKALAEVNKQLSVFEPKTLINPLISSLCHSNEIVRWHGVTILGQMVHNVTADNTENGRVIMRRFLWMLNDESGGIGWGVPEAMSEAMYHNRILAEEYLHMLVSYTRDDGPELFQDGNLIELPLLQQGVFWGLCRLADRYSVELITKKVSENISFFLLSKNSQVRGLASFLCGLLELYQFISQLDDLITDQGVVRIYADGIFRDYHVGDLAAIACEKMASSDKTHG